MFTAVSRVFVIAMMLIAFVGQAIAFNTSVSCETPVNSPSPDFSELVKQYDSNPTDTDSPDDCCGIECCDLECTCIANACSSFLYFNTEVDANKTATLSEVISRQQFEQPKSIANLLYRPPIFTS